MPLLGGKFLLEQPIAFESGAVSIGDFAAENLAPSSVLVGVGSTISSGADRSVVSGYLCSARDPDNVVIGQSCQAQGPSVVCLGDHNTITFSPTSEDTFVQVGNHLTISGVVGRIIQIGSSSSTATNTDTISIGHDNTISDNSYFSVLAGRSLSVGVGFMNSILIGHTCAVSGADTGDSNILVGLNLGVTDPTDLLMYNVLVGTNSTVAGHHTCVIGHTNVVGKCFDLMVYGSDNEVGDNTQSTFIVGNTINCLGASECVLLGSLNDAGANTSTTILAGRAITTTNASTCVALGLTLDLGDTPVNCIVIGNDVSLPDGAASVVVIGDEAYASNASVAIGKDTKVALGGGAGHEGSGCVAVLATIGNDTNNAVSIGGASTVGNNCGGSVSIGSSHVLDTSPNSVAICNSTVNTGLDNAVAIGNSTVSGSGGVAIGNATAGANACAIGGTASTAVAIHSFTVWGWSGASLPTLAAVDNPAADSTGLSVVYNDGVTTTSKTLKAAASPPVGALLVYVDP